MKETVAIVGSHPGTRGEFDFSRTDCDIWLFNEAAQADWAGRCDAVFQMHAPVIFRNPGNRNNARHYDWLRSGETPAVYMQEQYEDVPRSVTYPRHEIRSLILANFNGGQEYYTSSPAYAIALAVYSGYRRIEIYGVEMETDTEYRFQRDGIAFWVGVAVGQGIEVELHSRQFLVAPLYGYEGDVKLEYEYFLECIERKTTETKSALAEYEDAKAATVKAIDDFAVSGQERDAVAELIRTQVKKAHHFGICDGARQENERYKRKADVMREAAGGEFIFVRQEFEQALHSLAVETEKQKQLVNVAAIQAGQLFEHASQDKNHVRRKIRVAEVKQALDVYITESTKLGIFTGAAIENKQHLDRLTELIRAAGGSKSEAVMVEALQVAA